jgi:hypothetical protein
VPKPASGEQPGAAPNHWTKPSIPEASGPRYSVTVTSVTVCAPTVQEGKMWLGVELLIENRGATQMTVARNVSAHDDQGYRYRLENYDFGDASPCQPRIDYEKIKPGDKLRGWVSAFRVPVNVGKLVIDSSFAWETPRGSRATEVEEDWRLPIGQLDSAGH